MSGFGLVYRSALRTRWRSWLVLAGLVAITGGACLAALAAGQRTGSAVPRLLASTGSPDAQMISGPIAGSPTSVPYPTVAALPGVLSDARGSAFYYAQLLVAGGEQSQTNGGAGVVSFPTGPGSLHPKLLAGRFPDPSKPDEVLADYALENSFPHVRVGARVVVTLLAADQPAGVLTNEVPPVLGATVTMTVVGLDVDGPSLPAGSQDAGTVQVTPAFVHEYGAGSFSGAVDILRLRGGAAGLPRFEAALQAVPGVAPGLANVGVVGADAGYAVVEASIHPQVVGWWILAALTGCAAAAVIVQALSRQAALEADSYPALRSIGFSPRGLFLLGMARNAVVGIVGAVAAVALAYALSPLTPVGLARIADPSPGLSFDAPVLLLGLVAVIFGVALAGLWPAWRAAVRKHGGDGAEDAGASRASRPAEWLARVGAAPSAVLGTRLALERRPGRDAVPITSSLVGAAVAVAALVGTAVFGASLAHLMATPRLYGNDFQLGSNGTFPGNLVGNDVEQTIQSAVGTLPGVTRVTLADVVAGNAGTTPVSVLGLTALHGPLSLSMVSGRPPRAAGEVVLGAGTLRALHTRIGGDVRLTIATSTATYRVVGTATLPLNFDGADAGMGNGAVVTMGSMAAAVCGCPVPDALNQGGSENLYVSFANRASLLGAESAVLRAVSQQTNGPLADFALAPDTTAAPAVFVSFGLTINFPLLLSLIAATFAAASLIHLLLVSVRRSRREIGVLKAIGFVRHQVAAEVGWQSAAVIAVGIVVGTPLGIAAGRLAWNLFAASYGIVDVVVIKGWQLGVILAASLVGAEAIAAVPALVAARVRPAAALRRG